MAIVMVFTMMPNTMGVETAWADASVITTAEGFAAMDANGSYVLGGNITISQPYSKEFSGTFDGKGYTVELNITGTEANTGLFSTLVGGATVKNVITAGEIRASSRSNVGGIAGKADTSNGSITIEKCKNTADISGYEAVGGILGFGYSYEGSNSVTIEECANIGNITGSNNKIGGIAGNLENSHAIRNCYNTGDIIGFNNYAGIIGRGAKGISVENCYTTGTITAYGSSTNAGYAIMGGTGSGTKCTVSNSYAVKGCATELCYSSSRYSVDIDTVSNFKESESMKEKAFATALGEKFRHNEGTYPTLEWEISTAKVPFNITPANAQLTITKTSAADEGSVVYTGTGGTIALPVGDYSYTVSCEGYTPETGSVSVTDGSGTLTASPNSVSRSLDKDTDKWGTVTFAVSGANNYEIKLTQNGVEVQPTSEKNKYELLINKEYSYVVSSSETGVEQAEGSIILTEGAKTKTEVVRLKKVVSIKVKTQPEKTQYYVGDKTIDTTGLVITVAYNDNSSADITSGFETSGLYTETVRESQDITVSYKGATAKYQISIKEKPFPSSVFNALAGKAEVKYISSDETKVMSDDAFSDATKLGAECLKSNIERKKNMSATVQIDFSELDRAYELSFDYILSAEGSSYDYIKINNEQIATTNHTEWKTYVLQVKKGDKVEITYRKDSSGDKLDDCIYLKDFRLKNIPQVTFNTVPAYALVSMKAADGTEAAVSESADGKTIFAVQNGTYHYTVSAFGYESQTDTITVGSEDVTKDITLTKLASHKARFNVKLPDDLKGKESEISITVKSGDTIVKPEADRTYSLPQGEYTYTITHPNCEAAEGEFTIAEVDVTENVTLTRKLVFNDFFDKFADSLTATNDATYPFKAVKGKSADGSDNYLESTNKNPDYYSTTRSDITLKAEKPIKLSFDAYYSAGYSSWSTTIYGLIVEKNDEQQLYRNGKSKDWETLSIKCDSGDTVKIGYKDYNSYSYENLIRLKNFNVTALYKLTFVGAPAGTMFVVKQGETVIEAEADGSYLLTNGSYTYTASAFGYEDANGSITVNDGDVSETVSMNKTAAYTVTFNITKPSGITAEAAVAVKSGNTVITADEDGTYNLPADTYSYTITCEGCETETGEFTVGAEAMTVEVTLEKTLTFGDFFTELNGRADITNDTRYAFKPVKEGAVKYLQSSNTSDGTTGIITFTFQKSTKLNFKYMVSENGSEFISDNYGLIIERNNQKIAEIEEISENWKDYSILAKTRDVITLTYKCYVNTNDMSSLDKNFVRLKDFTAVPLTEVSFEGMPKNAMISVKNGDNVIAPVDGSYLLEAGNYSYSVTAFGYMPTTNQALTIAGEEETKTVTVSMTETARHAVSFQVTPSGAAIVVKNEAGETMTALDGKASSYSLPANEKYSYEVSADGYVGKSGYFTADGTKKIEVTLESAGAAWDGTTTKEPTLKNGVYQISSAAELAWFAAKVSEDAAINGELTQNINLNDKEWTSFGAYDYKNDNSGFAGTLDGHGYSIIGLSGKGGLLDCIAPNGKVKNLNVFGKIIGTFHLGGIANTSKGTIENCLFSGTITNTYSGGSAAGIVGRAMSGNIIKNCVSHAEIANTSNGYNLTLNLGGIAGYTYGAIENCYFTGSISSNPNKAGNKAIGGLVGELKSSAALKNSYTTGAVTGPETGIGSVIGMNSGTVENTYVLENICAKTIATNYAQTGVSIRKKTAEEMREALFAYTLGAAYNQDNAADSINNGFPVLEWQGGTKPSVPQFEQNALADMDAIVIKDKTRADALEAEKKEYCEFGPDKEFKTEQEALEFWRRFYEDEGTRKIYMG